MINVAEGCPLILRSSSASADMGLLSPLFRSLSVVLCPRSIVSTASHWLLSRKIKNYQACILALSESCLWELQEIIHSEKSEVLRSNQFHLFSWQLVIWGLKASIEKVCCSCVFGCYSYTSLLNICSIISIDFLITSSPPKRRRFVCLVAGSTRTIPRKFKFL